MEALPEVSPTVEGCQVQQQVPQWAALDQHWAGQVVESVPRELGTEYAFPFVIQRPPTSRMERVTGPVESCGL
jgi:hypothetical protein